MNAQSRTIVAPEGVEGLRADQALAKLLGFTRSFAATLVTAGSVQIDGRPARKSDRLRAGSLVEVTWSDERTAAAPPSPVPDLAIVHDDDDIVVIDKPAGVAAHPALGWQGPTVVGALRAAGFVLSSLGPAERTGIVHRLDAGTSGLMVVAKSDRAYSALKEAFREHTVTKIYHTVVQGHPDPLEGTIDGPIGRHPNAQWRFAVVAGGKPSVTHYRTLEAFRHASLLEVRLETGRTHQIRVHMSARRHPCLGDTMYGADPTLGARLGLERQWLHAVRLGFRHPGTGDQVVFDSAYPPDLQHALDLLDG
ncbi:MAG TPA: RluA family pseudouridine synthase [Microbacteriaceae bacterium]|nr:RluA family pseudouridine synthase [Microbacteriaceae bacterium]